MLNTRQLKVYINSIQILHGLTFEVPSGTFTGILGPNGSGKTTLLRAISGVLPYDGDLEINGVPLSQSSRKKRAQHISVVQQNTAIHFDFTAFDFMLLGRTPHKGWFEHTSKEDYESVERIVQSLQLQDLCFRTIPTLSGGERQRVLLGQALVQNPSLLLLDEPTTHLDIYHQLDLMSHIRSLVEEGQTVLAVFHDLELALQFSDLLLVLNKGKQVAFGTPTEVLTPDLIKEVFRIHVDIYRDNKNHLHLHYLNIT